MRSSTSACCVLALCGSFAAVSCLPRAAHAQCDSHFELFAASAPRNLNFAFFDPATGRTIATETPFTGAGVTDTWAWDGAAWRRIASGSGPANAIPAMVSRDTVRGKVVAVDQSCQTWEWDGTAWAQRANCPTLRCQGAATTFDAARGVTVLVTGGTGIGPNPPAETWEWDGAVWTQRAVTGPSNRHLHTLTYDPVRNVSVLIGGRIENPSPTIPTWLGDVWEYNGAAWTQRTFSGGPGTISDQNAVYHASLGGVVIYGGANYDLKQQMMVWNGTAWSSIPAISAGSQQDSSLMSDPAGSRLLLMGRIVTTADNYGQFRWQLYAKPDASGWTTLCRADDFTPNTGYQSSTCYDSDRGVVVVFGGVLATGYNQRDATTWEYDGVAWHKSPATGPGPRSQASMGYDPVRHRVVMVGGYIGNTSRPAETWEYDGTSWTLVSTSTVGARNGAAMTFDPVRGKLVMTGGRGPNDGFLYDTQTWDGASWTQIAASTPYWYCWSAFDENAQAVIGAFLSGGTRRLDGSTWTPIGSGPTYHDPFVWDASRGRLVGYQSNAGMGLRSWNGTAWQAESVSGVNPGQRDAHSVAYDARRGRVLLYGGYDAGGLYTNEMWELVRPTADMGKQGGLPGPDGQLDNNDFIVFITRFFNNSPLADVGKQGGLSGSDNQLDNNDFIAFIDLFFNGCGV